MTPTMASASISGQPAPSESIPVIKTREGAITKVTGDGLRGLNWVTWQVRMLSLLALCEVGPYVCGEIEQPDKEIASGKVSRDIRSRINYIGQIGLGRFHRSRRNYIGPSRSY